MKKLHWIIVAIVLFAAILGVGGYLLIDMVTPTIGLSLTGGQRGMENAVQGALESSGHMLMVENCGNDPEIQKKQIAALLEKRADVLVVHPVDPDIVPQILELAGKVPVLFVGDEPENLGNGYFVGCDKVQLGNAQATLLRRYFAKADINGDKVVDYMVLSGSKESLYLQGVNAAIGQYQTVKLEEAVCDPSAEEAKALCLQAFSKYGRDLELILCDSGEIALGAVEAIRETGRVPGRNVVVFGAGTEAQYKEAVRTGAVTAAVVEDVEALGDALVKTVGSLLGGEEIAHRNYVNHKLLTHEDVEE